MLLSYKVKETAIF